MNSNSVCNHTSDEQNWTTAKWESNLSITSMITHRTGQQKVLLLIDPNRYNFRKQQIHFGQMSPVEIISKVKKNLHFGSSLDFFRISGCCYGYCDYSVIGGFSEWIKYDWLLQLSYCSQLSYYIV